MIDSHTLKKNEDFEKLPNLYIIFILEHDIFRKRHPIYFVNKTLSIKGTTTIKAPNTAIENRGGKVEFSDQSRIDIFLKRNVGICDSENGVCFIVKYNDNTNQKIMIPIYPNIKFSELTQRFLGVTGMKPNKCLFSLNSKQLSSNDNRTLEDLKIGKQTKIEVILKH